MKNHLHSFPYTGLSITVILLISVMCFPHPPLPGWPVVFCCVRSSSPIWLPQVLCYSIKIQWELTNMPSLRRPAAGSPAVCSQWFTWPDPSHLLLLLFFFHRPLCESPCPGVCKWPVCSCISEGSGERLWKCCQLGVESLGKTGTGSRAFSLFLFACYSRRGGKKFCGRRTAGRGSCLWSNAGVPTGIREQQAEGVPRQPQIWCDGWHWALH